MWENILINYSAETVQDLCIVFLIFTFTQDQHDHLENLLQQLTDR